MSSVTASAARSSSRTSPAAARVFVTSCRFLTGGTRSAWLNTVVGVLEGVLDTETGTAHGRLFECRPTVT